MQTEHDSHEPTGASSQPEDIEELNIKRIDNNAHTLRDSEASGKNGSAANLKHEPGSKAPLGGRWSQPNKKGKQHWCFPGWLYGVLFVVFTFCFLAILQWGVTQGTSGVGESSTAGGVWKMVEKMQTGNYVFLLNMLLVGLVYLTILMLTNRFWIATGIMFVFSGIIAATECLKIAVRYETVFPSDLSFVSGGNGGEIASFIPTGGGKIILGMVIFLAVLVALCVFLNHIDGRHGSMIRFSGKSKALGAVIRILLVILPAGFVSMYTVDVGTTDSWAYGVSRGLGDIPSMWDSVYDAQRNGVVPSFIRAVNPKVMDEPENYSQATMEALAAKYSDVADTLNDSRDKTMTNSTVIAILSETFADPENVPGVKLNEDPLPNIRQIMSETTSGKMLSSGYGGGTANLEYMELTGLSMANFDSAMTSPYQQLIPSASWTPTFNQMWGAADNSTAIHPYAASMYSRATDYVKFGFSKFYALSAGTDEVKYQDKIGSSPYVSDESAYKQTIDQVNTTDDPQFIQLMTMQNHMPYNGWYQDNQFEVTSDDSAGLTDTEISNIQTYAKGISYTDEATKEFLDQLDQMDKPITVIFYGDHLPGIYKTASEDSSNSIALHETDYFIWSNKASGQQGVKIEDDAYTSPNFLVAEAAEQMNAKVSPYMAFLTELHQQVAAMEPPVANTIQGWDRIPAGSTIYLDENGNQVAYDDLSDKAKEMLEDYKLIQYDITAGDGYLKNTDFMSLPDGAGTM